MASSSSSSSSTRGGNGNKVVEMEEIVRHMSNLPSFLERGKPIQDKALNFGVMDWGRLEKWQYHRQKQGLVGSNKYSPSTSNSSLLSSTDESSPHSSRAQTSSSAPLKPHHVTLQSHLNVSSEGISIRRNLENSQDVKNDPCNSGKKTRNKPRSSKMNDIYTQNLPESSSSSSSSTSLKGKMKFQDSYDPKNNIPTSFPFENEAKSERNPITPEKKELSVSSKNSDFKTNTIQRTISPRHHRPSPLKKLLDPFFQSKSTSSGQHIQTFEDPKVKPKVKLDFGSCKEVKVGDDSRNKMKETPSSSPSSSSSSSKQALFQMAIKNGRPLFTFTVDNNDDILAATVRNSSEKDDNNSWIYTFFTIHEVKKKKGRWLSQGTKATSQGFLPNITAQMIVSNCSVSNCREFVLSSLDPSLPDELAAIVVKFLRKEENQDCFSMTAVLPGGHHSAPSKGEPSPLIDRWRSGGACDCGGWDIGCRLRTFTNKVELESNRRSNKFDLFFQGDVISERPFFSLSSLKEGIFSVEYDSSLSLLHAFSISISIMECRKSCQYTEVKMYVAKQVDEDDEAPVTYASLPPVSPVGRV
ncbi:uncharacterized protein LOC111907500 [Lactuca sativa]|uniref:DUF3527 domain-containing protein n=1 Tax=Lactuca sativa TaxID=4236 RepID=A0A9R1WUT1_LACSA|nr:uncharacterized protein LOC111907500 [Lactuca sativa]XP_023759066.1 uncharacterized protein LOC111907500 [Lactuca sativa]KAJ0186347.1 hypothetical protein LSAT_V11C900465270 [Lactuca sativa]